MYLKPHYFYKMKEAFLHYIWQYKLFSSDSLVTSNGEPIRILKSGSLNKNTGPDFLNAQLQINQQIWVGNVEIHLKASDWYAHTHETDANYDAVILHVVYENDAPVFMKNNQPLPTLELKNNIDTVVFKNYKQLFSKKIQWIYCEQEISKTDTFVFHNWLERLYFERLEEKSIFIKKLLTQFNNNFEAVLFQLIAKNFGLNTNSDAFLQLAQSVNFSVIRKERFNEFKLTALLFGQAGFLTTTIEDEYYKQLQTEYKYLQHKHQLKPIAHHLFQFFRMRPANFPTIRLAQLVALYHKHQNLFSKLMNTYKIDDFYSLLSIEINDFWKTHYTFSKTSKKSAKKLTKSFIDLLLINTIIPFQFVYYKMKGNTNNDKILQLIQQIKPEKNSIISKFIEAKINTKNAFETQALLQLKNEYCTQKRCLNCAVGNSLLRGYR